MRQVIINGRLIGGDHPTYFIADIAANHDGDLERARDLIKLAAESGADAAKFQNFQAATIVSDYGFRQLGASVAHQSNWEKSVYEVYQDASLPLEWTSELKAACDDAGIDFFTAPYATEILADLADDVCAWKVGSGDITWHEHLQALAKYDKPILLATGASCMAEVTTACQKILEFNQELVLMQCNTNYTGDYENIRYVALNVLKEYQKLYPDVVLGLSDHTPGHVCVLGAVSLGARVIEKHFTDDVTRQGPDHKFSMTPSTWRKMVNDTRWLERSLGDRVKRVMENEKETAILQRRSLRLRYAIKRGTKIEADMLIPLRPCPEDGLPPCDQGRVVGKTTTADLIAGQHITWRHLV
jgi:sialic acid synthase SpsE